MRARQGRAALMREQELPELPGHIKGSMAGRAKRRAYRRPLFLNTMLNKFLFSKP
jgi:hypothetical protein